MIRLPSELLKRVARRPQPRQTLARRIIVEPKELERLLELFGRLTGEPVGQQLTLLRPLLGVAQLELV